MSKRTPLADYQHDLVRKTAAQLVEGTQSATEKFERLLLYVRDEIKFGFPKTSDFTTASQTIKLGLGQCNTKATLLLALCKAVNIPARIHFSLISKDIQKGFFTGFAYRLMPDEISHSWIEVKTDGLWQAADSFINDQGLQSSSERELRRRGWETGLSVALDPKGASCGACSSFGTYQQMAAVTQDHGVFDEPADYYQSPSYANRPGLLKLLLYRVNVNAINRRVEALRAQAD